MFIGYQGNIANYIANTKSELNNKKHVKFDRIEEVEFAEMFNGVIYTSEEELIQAKTKTVEETRASLYTAEVDPLTSQINRLRDEEQTPETIARIEELKILRSAKVEEIKANNPYPVAEKNSTTEVVISKMENAEE